MIFRWDPQKAAANRRKHGIDFHEATTVLGDPLSTTFPDPEHSVGEQRFITVGVAASGRVLVVVYRDDGQKVRIISARRATRRERRFYEEGR